MATESQRTGRLRLRHLLEVTEAAEEEMVDERARFAALAKKEAPKVFSSMNLFPTPPDLASRVIELAGIQLGHKVLEPSAGTGNLLRAIAALKPYERRIEVTAVEINGPLWNHLSDSEFSMFTDARLADFLTWETPHKFDRIVMNPPFKMGRDIKHIERALTMLAPSGRLVAICSAGPRQRAAFESRATWIDLPAGAFKSEGTSVNAAIVVFG